MEIFGIPIVDILIVIIILLGVLEGLFRGFIVVAMSFLSYIISLLVAKMFYPKLSNFMMNSTDLFGDIKKGIDTWIVDLSQNIGADQIVNNMKLPDVIKASSNTQIQESVNQQTNIVSTGITGLFFNIVSIVLIFIAVKFLLFIIMKLLDSVAQIPILKELNKLVGIFVGGVKGIFLVYVAFLLITPIITFAPDGNLATAVLESNLGPMFYYNNILWNFFSSIGETILKI